MYERELSAITKATVEAIKLKSEVFNRPAQKIASVDRSVPIKISQELAGQLRGEKPIGEGRLIGRDMANPPDTLEDLELECLR